MYVLHENMRFSPSGQGEKIYDCRIPEWTVYPAFRPTTSVLGRNSPHEDTEYYFVLTAKPLGIENRTKLYADFATLHGFGDTGDTTTWFWRQFFGDGKRLPVRIWPAEKEYFLRLHVFVIDTTTEDKAEYDLGFRMSFGKDSTWICE